MRTMKERSGTTRSQRTMNRRCPTDPQFGCSSHLELSPRGGPVGEGMRVTVGGPWRAAAAPGLRRSGKASVAVAVQEMGVRGMLYIPQRHYICTDRCSRANLRRRGGLLPVEPKMVLTCPTPLASPLPRARTLPRRAAPSTGPFQTRSSPRAPSGRSP